MEGVYIIEKKQIPDFINKSLQNYQVFGPVQKDGFVSFSSITKSCVLALDYLNTIPSPKHIFFPQTETLFKFSYINPVTLQESAVTSKDLIIFGIRPCDAHAIKIMDTVFHGTYPDKQYLTKRKKSIIIGIGCNNPPLNCFCTSVGGNPHDKGGLDVLFTDIGNRYYVKVITQKGNNLIKQYSFFSQAHKNDYKQCEKVTDAAQKKIKRHMDVNNIQNKLEKIFEHGIWENFSQACIGCGICTYLCPTCHCFDIRDESTSKRGGRIRVWDSCMYPEFTLQASGYNPRPRRKNRLRNRIYHKFYSFPQNNDLIACVGCGRCINMCPVYIDIIEIINQVREVSK